MIKISVTGANADGRNLQEELAKLVKQIADDVYKTAQANTPVRSGYARSKWMESVTSKTFNVSNKVPYIEKLEAGASRKAPKGIIGPTLTTIKGKYR